jgi:sugar phosphate isomerase/epimerase
MLKLGGAFAAAVSFGPFVAQAADVSESKSQDRWRGLKIGVASYSYRKLPLEACIKGIQRVALHYTSIKDFHLPMNSTSEQRKDVANKFRDAGINPISCGVVTINDDEKSARNAFEYARDIGVPTIVCSPEPAALPLCDKLVKEFDIKLAIHNHGPEAKDFKSPLDAMRAIQDLDSRIGVCIDVGHTARAGVDPATAIRTCKARLYDCHFKDINSPHGKSAGSSEVEVGRGILDIRGMLQALLEVGFQGHVGFEHEKDPNDPIPGMAESAGYTKGVLSGIGR